MSVQEAVIEAVSVLARHDVHVSTLSLSPGSYMALFNEVAPKTPWLIDGAPGKEGWITVQTPVGPVRITGISPRVKP